MCAIIGVASRTQVDARAWLDIGRDRMTHRGPDDSGSWWSSDGRVGLAHRRLAILDLSSAGHQPMQDRSGNLTIVFNGEIYNFLELRALLAKDGYVFSSHSDTEVILAAYRAWGDKCVSYLHGMFAFAIFDSRKQSMFLARDRAGEKPLFYQYANEALRFSSELKGLLADSNLERRLNREAADCYLTFGYSPGSLCILEGFNKLPPGYAMSFDLCTGALKTWRYWELPAFDTSTQPNMQGDDDLLLELEGLLESSVSKQMVADVPVGVLLSGGVDSSLVTAMAVRASSNVQTFSVGFPGYGQYDETAHARLIANYFGTEHFELVPEPTDADLLYRLARQFDEPIVDSSMIPTYLVSHLVSKHCTVALGGDGGDELFGGYSHYSRLNLLSERLGKVPQSLRANISAMAGTFLPIGFRGRTWLQNLGENLETGLPLVASHFDESGRKGVMSAHESWPIFAETFFKSRVPAEKDMVQRATRMDFENYLTEDILVKVDRASMMSSLEIRAPFLDVKTIEFAFSKVPSRLKATELDRKVILKRLCTKILPKEFDQKRKQGFSIPLSQWLKAGSLRELFHDVLTSSSCVFNKKFVESLFKGQDKGRGNSQRLYALVMFELWRREYGITI